MKWLALCLLSIIGIKSQTQLCDMSQCLNVDNCELSNCTINGLNHLYISKTISLYQVTVEIITNLIPYSQMAQLIIGCETLIIRNTTIMQIWGSNEFSQQYDHKLQPFLYLNASNIQISNTRIGAISSFYVYADRFFSATSSGIQAAQISIISNGSLFLNHTSILATYTVCKADCSCQQYAGCPSKETTPLGPYFSILNSLYEFQNMNLSKILYITGYSDPFEFSRVYLMDLNYTVALMVQNQTLIYTDSTVLGSFIGIYTSLLFVDTNAAIDTKGLGCAQSQGLGCGFLDWMMGLRLQCGGTGASHGGQGSPGVSPSESYNPTCLQMTSRTLYDSPFNPIYEGSGGGGADIATDYTQGGGVVYIESVQLTKIEGLIDASASNIGMNNFNGGSSGGTVQLRTLQLIGSGRILAEGSQMYMPIGPIPPLMQGYGGIGAGGRIMIQYIYWQNVKLNNYLFSLNVNAVNNVTISVKSGYAYSNFRNIVNQKNIYIQYNGSIITSPCLPGYHQRHPHYQCTACPSGKYKTLINNGECKICSNADTHAIFYANQSSPLCQIQSCVSGYHKVNAYRCVKESSYIMDHYFGGENGIFAIIVSGLLLVVSLIVAFVKSKSKKKKKSRKSLLPATHLDQNDLILKREESSAKGNFVTNDLPYHIKRVYLDGNNSWEWPWFIYENTELEFTLLRDYINLREAFHIFNQKAKFTFCQQFFLKFLKVYYYPFFYLLAQFYQQQKFTKLQHFFNQKKPELLNTNESGCFFKFSCSPDFTLAYIDILDYQQDVLGWTNELKLPLVVVLQGLGMFLFPLLINMKDPLFKQLLAQLNRHGYDEYDDQEDDQLSDFERFALHFNNLSRLIDFRQSLSTFVNQFTQLVQYVEEQNREKFNSQGLVVDMCIHMMAKVPDMQSKIIILNYQDRRDLEICLTDLHLIWNYKKTYDIKFSITFDTYRLQEMVNDQVVIHCDANLNRQIDEYKQYEDDKQELNNLKLKMKRKFEEDLQNQNQMLINKMQSQYQLSQYQQPSEPQPRLEIHLWQEFKRKVYNFSYIFVRYRFRKIDTRILMTLLLLILLFEFVYAFVYPITLYAHLDIGGAESPEYRLTILIEAISQVILFPLVQLLSPFILVVWVRYLFMQKLIRGSNDTGRTFLLFNFCCCISGFCDSIMGIPEIIYNGKVALLVLIKMISFLVNVLLQYLSCIQLNYNEEFDLLK